MASNYRVLFLAFSRFFGRYNSFNARKLSAAAVPRASWSPKWDGVSRVRDVSISYSELISSICRVSEKKMFSERAISRSVHGVEKVQFLWLCIDERMQKHAKYLILRRLIRQIMKRSMISWCTESSLRFMTPICATSWDSRHVLSKGMSHSAVWLSWWLAPTYHRFFERAVTLVTYVGTYVFWWEAVTLVTFLGKKFADITNFCWIRGRFTLVLLI